MSEFQPSTRVKRKRKDADRQQQRRDTMKVSGTPTTHVLNRAIVEGFMYQLDFARQNGRDMASVRISAQKAFAYATAILTSKTNGASRYELEAVVRAIRKRIGKPDANKFRVTHIPRDMLNLDALVGIIYADDLDDE